MLLTIRLLEARPKYRSFCMFLCDPNVKKQQSPANLEIGKCGNSEFDRDAFVIDCYFQM